MGTSGLPSDLLMPPSLLPLNRLSPRNSSRLAVLLVTQWRTTKTLNTKHRILGGADNTNDKPSLSTPPGSHPRRTSCPLRPDTSTSRQLQQQMDKFSSLGMLLADTCVSAAKTSSLNKNHFYQDNLPKNVSWGFRPRALLPSKRRQLVKLLVLQPTVAKEI